MKKHYGKKFVSLLLVILLTMTTACGKSNNSNESANAEQNSTKAVAGDNTNKQTVAQGNKDNVKDFLENTYPSIRLALEEDILKALI